jgi:hypothetical protein
VCVNESQITHLKIKLFIIIFMYEYMIVINYICITTRTKDTLDFIYMWLR